ncbi:MAG: DNA alkylation repair protein [Pseudomonadota bacterium]
MPSASDVRKALQALADPEIAAHSAGFFKTAPDEYGEGDIFIGVRVPKIRELVKQYRELPERAVLSLLRASVHEERMVAVLVLVEQFKRADAEQQERIATLYLDHREFVNNWDLVDSSCHKILGPWLFHRQRDRLFELARSASLWDRRIAMMTTYYFIRRDDFDDALALARILRNDEHDLIHKVVGWMLREIGKRDVAVETRFLQDHYQQMPRTMLRYAIEKLPQATRKAYLEGRA